MHISLSYQYKWHIFLNKQHILNHLVYPYSLKQQIHQHIENNLQQKNKHYILQNKQHIRKLQGSSKILLYKFYMLIYLIHKFYNFGLYKFNMINLPNSEHIRMGISCILHYKLFKLSIQFHLIYNQKYMNYSLLEMNHCKQHNYQHNLLNK